MVSSSLTRWVQVWRARIGFEARGDEAGAKMRIPVQSAQISGHRLAVGRDEIILAWAEQALDVAPGCADQRNAAGQGLEYPDRRDCRAGVST
jgi:hypothetical protein